MPRLRLTSWEGRNKCWWKICRWLSKFILRKFSSWKSSFRRPKGKLIELNSWKWLEWASYPNSRSKIADLSSSLCSGLLFLPLDSLKGWKSTTKSVCSWKRQTKSCECKDQSSKTHINQWKTQKSSHNSHSKSLNLKTNCNNLFVDNISKTNRNITSVRSAMDSYENDGVSILIHLTRTHYLLKRLIHSNQWKMNVIRNIQCSFVQLRLFQSLESNIRSIYSSIGRVFTCLIPSIDLKSKWGMRKFQRSSLGTIMLTVS